MGFIFESLGGGGEQKTTTTQKKVYPDEAAGAYQRDLNQLLTTGLPLWQALISQNQATMRGQPGWTPPATRAAGLAAPAVMGGGSTFDVTPLLQRAQFGAEAQAPNAFLAQLAQLAGQPVSGFYPPTIETEQVTEVPGPDPFQTILGLGGLGLGIAGLF